MTSMQAAIQLLYKSSTATATRTYVTQTSSTSNATVYTFASTTLGGSASDYIVIVPFITGVGSGTISSVTVEGNSTTQAVQATNIEVSTGMFIRQASGNATGSVEVTCSSGKGRCGIGVYRLTGISSSTPHATATDTATAFAPSVNVQAGGVVIAAGTSNNNSTATAWSGVTEDFDVSIESEMRQSAASSEEASASTPLSITFTPTGGQDHATCAASWSA